MATASARDARGSAGRWASLEFIGDLPGPLQEALTMAGRRARDERWAERLWTRDTTLWPGDEPTRQAMAERLGWLSAPQGFLDMAPELAAFASSIEQSFDGAVLAGMGGSSLAPALLARTFGGRSGSMPLVVLDSTDPDAVAAVDRARPPAETLYLIATKSGTTTETLAFLAHFLERGEAAAVPGEDAFGRILDVAHPGPEKWVADHFVAITDPGESVERIPYSNRFREVFLNPPDVGGRYSALTYVGLVPGALVGVDLDALLGSGVEMAEGCRSSDAADNPGLALGLAMGAFAEQGRDKLTLVLDPRIAGLGAWIEQLVAESTGKHGKGIVPVDGEALGAPEAYGDDRFFVAVALADGSDAGDSSDGSSWAPIEQRLESLAAAGHPVAVLRAPNREGLGGEFFRWEFATAVAGAVLGIDPFDEPNVTESKRNTERVLRERPTRELGVTVDDPALAERLAAHLGHAPQRGYLAITAFVAPTAERDAALARIRLSLRDATRHATTVGYGPRYLHSTGQLHKGGPPIGWFLQLVAGHSSDVPVPGRGYGFATLIDAQADGDLAALQAHGLPVLRVHLGDDPDAGLAALAEAVASALARRGSANKG